MKATESEKNHLSRKSFILSALGFLAALVALNFNLLKEYFGTKKYSGEIKGPNKKLGHGLRYPQKFSQHPQTKSTTVDTAIIGGGIGGLSAGWYLQKHGFHDYQIFELENHAGGNSSYAEQNGMRYPWGAHYLPVPSKEAVYVKKLLREMNILKGEQYDKRFLCYAQAERLFIYQNWQAGLYPTLGASDKDLAELEEFRALVKQYGSARGRDGKPAFAIPVAKSSSDSEFLQLRKFSMATFIAQHGFKSERLLWYINYACLDDFGSTIDNTSAWVGIHYYASRIHDDKLLVWPEGNGFLVKFLENANDEKISTGQMAFNIQQNKAGYIIQFFQADVKSVNEVHCKNIIYAAPKFTLPYVYPDLSARKKEIISTMHYSPWMVANLEVSRANEFTEPAWDNVIYGAQGLGYIDSDHQRLLLPQEKSMWTYYKAYGESNTIQSRQKMFAKTYSMACDEVLDDIAIAHPNISERIRNIDFYYWAHAMVRLDSNYDMAQTQKEFSNITAQDNFYFAHSDASGLSIFEEAQYHGVEAAKKVLIG